QGRGSGCQHLPLPTAHPEVLGVHVQLVAVQLRQPGVGVLDVVQVLHGFPKGAQHLFAMSTDLGVTNDGGGAGEVPEVIKEPLGPGVDDQQPGFGTAFLHVDFAPDAGDELLLLGGPVHHGVSLTSDIQEAQVHVEAAAEGECARMAAAELERG
uniref:Uncharacterized protein n=1 Tax=Pavo cristatus TaxID=9049 RepID=A0A8C9F9Z1_PAVCR